jgi:DNA modification methylase
MRVERIGEATMLGGKVRLLPGDCREVMATLPDASVDCIVCDPPYGLAFMGRAWDAPDGAPFAVELWQQALRVLKPGGHVVAFSGTRTYHRMVTAIEDAGFEIRDQLAWVYGSGFPKSHDVSKKIDQRRHEDDAPARAVAAFLREAIKAGGLTQREVENRLGLGGNSLCGYVQPNRYKCDVPPPALWAGLCKVVPGLGGIDAEVARLNERKGERGDDWKSAPLVQVKQAMSNWGENSRISDREEREPSPAARQWQGWGTALKPSWEPICLARKPLIGTVAANVLAHGTGALNIDGCRITTADTYTYPNGRGGSPIHKGGQDCSAPAESNPLGRWPANLLHDGSEEVVKLFPDVTSGSVQGGTVGGHSKAREVYGEHHGYTMAAIEGSSGSAARFFYTSKADAEDRLGSTHPTVKPVDLMQWLCRLVCPKGGTVLDPFAGTGTTGEAAWREGMRAILIEREPEYQADLARRMDLATQPTKRSAVAKTKNKLDNPVDLPLFGSLK